MALPATFISKFTAIYPYRATTPVVPASKFRNIAGGKLAGTESDTPGMMWVWARTQADADAAAKAMPGLSFGPSK